jgi:hypothetical protein
MRVPARPRFTTARTTRYAALKECPQGANIAWLKKKISQTIGSLAFAEQIGSSEASLFAPLFGAPADWWNLLDNQGRLTIEKLYHEWREVFGTTEDEEETAREVEDLLAKAGYPDDLDRYFEVLRQNGLSLKLAATQVHHSRGKFESWEFSSSAGRSSSVMVRFWHDTHTVDWEGILYDGHETKEKAGGHSLTQLENVLERWAAS